MELGTCMGLGLLSPSTAHTELHVVDYSTNNSALVGYLTNLSQMKVLGGERWEVYGGESV